MPRQNIIIAVVVILLSFACWCRTSLQEQIFHYTLHKVERSALESKDPDSLLDGAFGGMLLEMGDYPYSAYLPPEEEADYEEEIQGRLAGIGVSLLGSDGKNPPGLWIIPMYKGPADEAGLRFGDRITAADGKDFAGLRIDEISKCLRGDPDTEVTLTVIGRDYFSDESDASDEAKQEAATRQVTIKRRLLQQDIVSGCYRNKEGDWVYTLKSDSKTGYIKIEQFTDSTGPDFLKALETLDGKIDRLILDLRGNPGGFLPAAVTVAQPFLQKGDAIVTTRHRDGSVKDEFFADGGKKYDWPIAILIDSGSASASEIVSASLSDHHRAVLVGHRSFGKGTVQQLFPLPCGRGMLRLTVASFWRPSGEPIHRRHDMKDSDIWGVQPDYPVEMPLKQLSEVRLYQGIASTTEYEENGPLLDRLAQECLASFKDLAEMDNSGEKSDSGEPAKEKAEESADQPLDTPPGFDPVLNKALEVLTEKEPADSKPEENKPEAETTP